MSDTFYRRGFALVTMVLVAYALYLMLASFRSSLAWAVCLAFLLAPVQRWLSARLRGRAGTAAGLLTILVPVLLAGPLITLAVAFANQMTELVNHLKQQPLRLDTNLLAQLERYPLIGRVVEWFRQHLDATTVQLQEWLIAGGRMLMQSLAESSSGFLLGALGTVIHFFMMLFLLFFLLRDGRQLLDRTIRLVPMEDERRRGLFQLIGDTTRAVVFGTGITAIIQGTLVGIGFAIAGLPSAVVFGVLAALLALLPVGGAALVWVPAVGYLLANSQWGWALFMLAWGAVLSLSDNVLRPLLISRQAPVAIPLVFIGVIGGISAFGMIGVVIGPVLLTVVVALVGFFEETRLPSGVVPAHRSVRQRTEPLR